jgi:hypothetical protein
LKSEIKEQSLQMYARFNNFCVTFDKKLEQQASLFDDKKRLELASRFDTALERQTDGYLLY